MSNFLLRRGDDGDLKARVADLEQAHMALARELEASRAETQENVALLTLLGIEPWLRDLITRAKASDWRVECSPKGIVFMRPEGEEHTVRVPVPLPEDCEGIRRKLLGSVAWFEQQRLAS